MASTINENDQKLVALVSEYRVLTVKQLSALSQRSFQVVRRRNRILEMEGLVATKMQRYGRGRGRPEELVFLTEKGAALLGDDGIPSGYFTGKAEDASPDHHLLVNWFRIHLLQIERSIPQLSVKYLDPYSRHPSWDTVDGPLLPEHDRANKKQEKSAQSIPDGIFSITSETEKKTLLFFLEADMGTESLAGPNWGRKDIRQKILRYQGLFRKEGYKKCEKIFDAELNGFRLLFLANSAARMLSLCGLVREMQPSGFIWLSDQERMFSHGLSADIWARGGRNEDSPQSILGPRLACQLPVVYTDTKAEP